MSAAVNSTARASRSSAEMATDLVAALAAAGTRLVFGLPGGGSNLDVVGAAERAGLRFVLTHGETAAATMAGVAAELTGVPGACLVTRGPGVASAINGVAQALLDRQPIVVISDCVEEAERDRVSHQRIDQRALMAPVTKASLRYGPADVDVPAQAVALVAAGRPGPVHLDFDPDRDRARRRRSHRAGTRGQPCRAGGRPRAAPDVRSPSPASAPGASG